jgi:hypothetical protein
MSYVRCLRGLVSGIEYPAGVPLKPSCGHPADDRPVDVALGEGATPVLGSDRDASSARPGRLE